MLRNVMFAVIPMVIPAEDVSVRESVAEYLFKTMTPMFCVCIAVIGLFILKLLRILSLELDSISVECMSVREPQVG